MTETRPDDQQPELALDDLIRRALATPPITNEEIERRSKEQHGRKASQ